jgi:uncharacterized membrane protein YgdD (TMEM256/DUF423 family)
MSGKLMLFIACISGASSVALGAFGAHILKSMLTADQLNIYETAVRYQFYHSLALLANGLLIVYAGQHANSMIWSTISAYAFIAGLLLFSGSLYLIIAMQYHQISTPWWIGMLTPLGGLCFILGWISLAVAAWKI